MGRRRSDRYNGSGQAASAFARSELVLRAARVRGSAAGVLSWRRGVRFWRVVERDRMAEREAQRGILRTGAA